MAPPRRRFFELHLATLLALLLVVGAWSAAQRREAPPPPTRPMAWLGKLTIDNSTGQYIAPPASTAGSAQNVSPPPTTSSVASDITFVSPAAIDGTFTGAIAPSPASTVNPPSGSQLVGGTTFRAIPATPLQPAIAPITYTYAWPTDSLATNLLVAFVLLCATVLVVERLARRRLRLSLAELLLAVTVAAVAIVLTQSYWSAMKLTEVTLPIRVILLAAAYCALLIPRLANAANADHRPPPRYRKLIIGISRRRRPPSPRTVHGRAIRDLDLQPTPQILHPGVIHRWALAGYLPTRDLAPRRVRSVQHPQPPQ